MVNIKFPAALTLQKTYSFLIFVTFFQGMGGLMGWLTRQDIESWYRLLKKSPLTPPDPVFGMAWSALYLMLAIAAWLIWRAPRDEDDRRLLLYMFLGHMILNWLWTPLFFTIHATGMALILLYVLIFTAAMIAWLAWRINRAASLLLAPYIGWLIFAGHLTQYVWRHN